MKKINKKFDCFYDDLRYLETPSQQVFTLAFLGIQLKKGKIGEPFKASYSEIANEIGINRRNTIRIAKELMRTTPTLLVKCKSNKPNDVPTWFLPWQHQEWWDKNEQLIETIKSNPREEKPKKSKNVDRIEDYDDFGEGTPAERAMYNSDSCFLEDF